MHSKLPYARTLFEFELDRYDLGGETLTIAVAQPAAADKALKCTSWLPLKVSRHRPKAFSTHTHNNKKMQKFRTPRRFSAAHRRNSAPDQRFVSHSADSAQNFRNLPPKNAVQKKRTAEIPHGAPKLCTADVLCFA